jgi:hypothetical protein
MPPYKEREIAMRLITHLAIATNALALLLNANLAKGKDSPDNPALDNPKTGGEEATVEMREVSALEKNEISSNGSLMRWVHGECSIEPDKAVKTYPKLKSKEPLYGKFVFDRERFGGKSIEYHFVLDESGETPKGEKKNKVGPSDKPAGAIEKPEAAKQPEITEPNLSNYDRLYFDLNRDLDLTNDPVLMPMKGPPSFEDIYAGDKEKQVFDFLKIDIDYGAEIGVQPFQLLPLFTIFENQEHKKYPSMSFAATTARQGRIKIGKQEYHVVLTQPYVNITGRFNRMENLLYIKPVDSNDTPEKHGFYKTGYLGAARQADGVLYTFSATPLGDKLTVKRYCGEYGVLRVVPGRPDLKKLSIEGILCSDKMQFNFGHLLGKKGDNPDARSEYQVPVGDYYPYWLTIHFGRLRMEFTDNTLADGRRRDANHPKNRFIKIRKDKPFVLDFSNKPEVLFANPAKDTTLKLGDLIHIEAALIDPVCDIVFWEMDDTSRMEKEILKYDDGTGMKEHTEEKPLSLAPLVTITDSAGKKIAEGAMPFG